MTEIIFDSTEMTIKQMIKYPIISVRVVPKKKLIIVFCENLIYICDFNDVLIEKHLQTKRYESMSIDLNERFVTIWGQDKVVQVFDLNNDFQSIFFYCVERINHIEILPGNQSIEHALTFLNATAKNEVNIFFWILILF
jgi:hypothetical protein